MDFTVYDPSQNSLGSLASAIFGGAQGVVLVPGSVSVRTGLPSDSASTIAYYSGGISALHIGAGLMLTTGDPTPPTSNTSVGFGIDTGPDQADADLQATVDAAFSGAGTLRDLTYLQFHINVTEKGLIPVHRHKFNFGMH